MLYDAAVYQPYICWCLSHRPLDPCGPFVCFRVSLQPRGRSAELATQAPAAQILYYHMNKTNSLHPVSTKFRAAHMPNSPRGAASVDHPF